MVGEHGSRASVSCLPDQTLAVAMADHQLQSRVFPVIIM